MSAPELLALAIIAAGFGATAFRLRFDWIGAILLSTAFWLVLAAAAVAGGS